MLADKHSKTCSSSTSTSTSFTVCFLFAFPLFSTIKKISRACGIQRCCRREGSNVPARPRLLLEARIRREHSNRRDLGCYGTTGGEEARQVHWSVQFYNFPAHSAPQDCKDCPFSKSGIQKFIKLFF